MGKIQFDQEEKLVDEVFRNIGDVLTLGFLKATVFLQWKVIVCAALKERLSLLSFGGLTNILSLSKSCTTTISTRCLRFFHFLDKKISFLHFDETLPSREKL